MTITFHEDAEAELAEAVLYYDRRATGLRSRFLEEVRAASERVAAYPEAAPLTHYGARAKTLASFPYSLMYYAEPAEVFIVAVAQQNRRVAYWSDRLAPQRPSI